MSTTTTNAECSWCYSIHREEDMVKIQNGDLICRVCHNNSFECNNCGETYPEEEMVEVNDDCYGTNGLCQTCADSVAIECCDCGYLTYSDCIVSDRQINICNTCFEDHWGRCYECDTLIDRRDEPWYTIDGDCYCQDCYDNIRNRIKVYCYKPNPTFYDNGENYRFSRRYLGVELEIDGGGYDDDNAKNLMELMGDHHIYCKEDGSLSDGFEIVSHPMTLSYHKDIPWKDVLRCAVSMDYTSHNVGTCGLHVHVNRTCLGATLIEQEANIALLLFLFEKFWSEMVKFSRRTRISLSRWARRYCESIPECPNEILSMAKNMLDRYMAINICPTNTVELRIFRGTLRFESFMATLEFVDSIVAYVINTSIEDVQRISWNNLKDILSDGYEYLGEYFEYRNL